MTVVLAVCACRDCENTADDTTLCAACDHARCVPVRPDWHCRTPLYDCAVHDGPRTYTVTRPANTIYNLDGSVFRAEPAEVRTFTTGAALLRWAMNERVFRTHGGGPRMDRPDQPHLNSQYGMGLDSFCRWKFGRQEHAAMARAQRRYGQIVDYLRNVEPEWRPDTEYTGNETGIIHFADNSTELHEISKYGTRRHRMIEYPHGDVCF